MRNFAPVKLRIFILSILAAATTTAMAAVTHDATATATGTTLEAAFIDPDTTIVLTDVSVTAIKQGSRDDDASAATVVGRQQIERQRLVTVRDVSNLVPNFFLPDYGSRMTSTIYVRGLGARIDQPAMGLNIDNVPVMCKENYDFDLPDIARVEMLRGPQSTLYGRNTMGGLMNIYTLSPLSWQGTRIIAQMASHMSVKLGASHYAKLNDKLGLSAGVYYTTTRGEFTNEHNGKRCDWERQGSARVKLEWKPSSTLSVSNTLSASLSRQGGYPYKWLETGRIAYNDTCFYRRTSIMDGLTLTKHFDSWSLSSITSYQYINDNMTLDQDFTPMPYFTLTQARREHALTQELVARSTDDETYRWLVGAFGFYRRYRMDAPVTFKDTGIASLIEEHVNKMNPYYPVKWNERSFELGSEFTNPSWGVALYHQSSLDWKRFTFTAGLRLDYEHSTLRYHSETHTGYDVMETATGNIYRSTSIDIDDSGSLSKHFVQLLPKFSVTYHLPTTARASIYASASKGYKAGGFNTQMFSDVLQQRLMGLMGIGAAYDVNQIVGYRPEKAWNYELGAHFETTDNRLRADIALFYIDCRDRQLTIFPDGTTTGRVMTNAGKTRSLGAEASLNVNITDDLGLNLSYGYCDARFIRYNDGKADYKDRLVPYCPQHTLFARAFYTYNIKGDSPWARAIILDADLKGAGAIYWNEANSLNQPFYALLGASVTLAGKHYSLQLWGSNLTGTRYSTFYFVSISHEFLQQGRGRMLGATLRINI